MCLILKLTFVTVCFRDLVKMLVGEPQNLFLENWFFYSVPLALNLLQRVWDKFPDTQDHLEK